jgi:hypothetical protein
VVPFRLIQVRTFFEFYGGICELTDAYSRSYGAAMVGVATAKSPCGPFSFRGSFKPFGTDSRDMGVYVDGM